MRPPLRLLPLSLLFGCSIAAAQSAPPPGPAPMGPDGVPSPAALAAVPGLSVEQQQRLRQLLIQRRDAHEALRQREQTAHDKIDTDSANRIRALLGDAEYARYAAWSLDHGPHGHDAPPPQNEGPLPLGLGLGTPAPPDRQAPGR